MTAPGNLEREVKLDVELGFELPGLSDLEPGVVVNARPDAKLHAVYFDTPDLRLMRWGITLRHRRDLVGGEAGESEWTLKLPVDADGVAIVRNELSWPGDYGPVPAEVAGLVRGVARTGRIEPVADLISERRRLELLDEAGRMLAEIDDDLVSVMDRTRLVDRFRQVEVEVADEAAPELVDELLARLTAAGAVAGDDRPKVVRAIGSRASLGPDVVVPKVGPKATVATVVQASIAAGLTRIIRHDPGVRLGDDPEHVHQARVGARRLRSDLKTFSRLLDEGWTTSTRAELGWLAGALGEVRDADVLTGRLRAQIRSLPDSDAKASAGLLRKLALQRDEARRRLLEVLDSDRYLILLENLSQAAVDPPLDHPARRGDVGPSGDGPTAATEATHDAALSPTPIPTPTPTSTPTPGERRAADVPSAATPALGERRAVEVMVPVVGRPWKKLKRAVAAVDDDSPNEALHQVRIRAKRVRYAAEAVEPVIGKPARRLAAAAAELQGVLGDLQDAVVAEAWLRRQGSGSAAQALVAGELVTLERQKQAAARAAWPAAWKAASGKSSRSWLHG